MNIPIKIEHLKRGVNITCLIQNAPCHDAKIQVENGTVYVCQNVADGSTCEDKLGYEYSWIIGSFTWDNTLRSTAGEIFDNIVDFFEAEEVENVMVKISEWDEVSNR